MENGVLTLIKNWKNHFCQVSRQNIWLYRLYRTMYTFRIYMVLHNFAYHVNGYFVLRTEKKLTFSNFLIFYFELTLFRFTLLIWWTGKLHEMGSHQQLVLEYFLPECSFISPWITFLFEFQNPVSDTWSFLNVWKWLSSNEFQGILYDNFHRKPFTILKIRLLRQAAILLELSEFSERIQISEKKNGHKICFKDF